MLMAIKPGDLQDIARARQRSLCGGVSPAAPAPWTIFCRASASSPGQQLTMALRAFARGPLAETGTGVHFSRISCCLWHESCGGRPVNQSLAFPGPPPSRRERGQYFIILFLASAGSSGFVAPAAASAQSYCRAASTGPRVASDAAGWARRASSPPGGAAQPPPPTESAAASGGKPLRAIAASCSTS